MNAIWQVLLALLAAVGLLALGWLTFGRLLTPVGGGGGGPVYAVVPASGDGAHLEQDVKGFSGCGAASWPASPSSSPTAGWTVRGGRWPRPCWPAARGSSSARRSGWGVHQGMKGSAGRRTFSARRGRAAHFRRGKADETAFAGRQIGAQMI